MLPWIGPRSTVSVPLPSLFPSHASFLAPTPPAPLDFNLIPQERLGDRSPHDIVHGVSMPPDTPLFVSPDTSFDDDSLLLPYTTRHGASLAMATHFSLL